MDHNPNKRYRDRLRILLIIYFFSEDCSDAKNPSIVGLLKSEVKIQKLDFFIRYPSYLCYELILKMEEDSAIDREEVKSIVREILESNEPEMRTLDMKKFLYGAWESLDLTLNFLKAHGLIDFDSKVGSDLHRYQKEYFLTRLGKTKVLEGLSSIPGLEWYNNRCLLIKKYFGNLSGTELKALQYGHEKYKGALINEYIQDISYETRELFVKSFKEEI